MLYTRGDQIEDALEHTLVSVPAKHIAICTNAFISNHGSGTLDVSLWWSKPSGTDVYLLEAKNMASKEIIRFGDAGNLVLQAGQSIKFQAGSAGDVGVFVTFDLVPAPAALNEFNGS